MLISSYVSTWIKGKFKKKFLKIIEIFLVRRVGCCLQLAKNLKIVEAGAGKKQTGSAKLVSANRILVYRSKILIFLSSI